MSNGFLFETEPVRGAALPVLPGIVRVVATNPGPMSYHGTNTYLLDNGRGETIVIDPGPDDAAHVSAIVAAASQPISRILLTHTHHDHLGATAALKAATGAPTFGFHRSADAAFTPDVPLSDGDIVEGLAVVHTPGHAPDHICFARADGLLFSGDHVMGWSSTIVNPPKGNMIDYFASLNLLLRRNDAIYLPGHGPAIREPHVYVRALLRHRQQREDAILSALQERARGTFALMDGLYSKIDPTLRWAAERNVLAHLAKLQAEGRVVEKEGLWSARAR